jgi:hypothetical protein
MPSLSNVRLSRISLVVGFAAAVAACTGGTTNSPLPQNGTNGEIPGHTITVHARRVRAVVGIPMRAVQSNPEAVVPRLASNPIADEALQIGRKYPSHEFWQIDPYNPLDPSCGMLNWTYTNTIPGVTVTLNPMQTSLTGQTYVSFTKIPTNTAVQQWAQTITPACTNPNATGTLPVPTTYTIYTVTMDIGRNPQVLGPGTIITNAIATPVVGQFVELDASPQPNVRLVKTKWSPIPGDTVKIYTETPNQATVTDLSASDLLNKTVAFYWIHGSNGKAKPLGVYAVFPTFNSHCLKKNCTGAENFWGETNAYSSADVVAPTGVSITSVTGNVGAGIFPFKGKCVQALFFGTVEDACGIVSKVGIDWTMKATAPAGGSGLLDATQLIDRTNAIISFPGVHASPAPPGTHGTYELDSCMQSGTPDAEHQPIVAGSEATYDSNDSPAHGLNQKWKLLSSSDTFTTFFVYRPDDQSGAPAGRKNIWVPLGLLDWNWKGIAENRGTLAIPKWILASHSNAKNPSGVVGDYPLPTWSALFRPSEIAICPPEV